MADFPAMPFFTDAYMADTEHLTDAEHGLYLRVLMTMWRSPDKRLPNDDAWLARRFRKTPQEVLEVLRPLLLEFCQTDGNWITQKRLSREWEYVKTKSKKNSDAAKSRWGNNNDSSVRNAPTPTPTPTYKKKNGFGGKKREGRTAGEIARLELAKKGIPNISNTPQDFDIWIAAGELTHDQARKAGASI